MSNPIAIPAVSVTYAQDGTSTSANGSLGHTLRSIEEGLPLFIDRKFHPVVMGQNH
jgi:hypothetical protein